MNALQVFDQKACAARAAAEAPALPKGRPLVNVAIAGLSCALSVPGAEGEAFRAKLEPVATTAIGVPEASEDERYQLYEALAASRRAAKDDAGLHRLALRYLEDVEHAPPPRNDDERMARDLALVRAAAKAGVADRVIPALEASERALPGDYNASARLAAAYAAAGRLDDAVAACTRGLARSPGPAGTARLLMTRARAEAQKGDKAAARQDLTAGLDALATIHLAAVRDPLRGALQSQLDSLN